MTLLGRTGACTRELCMCAPRVHVHCTMCTCAPACACACGAGDEGHGQVGQVHAAAPHVRHLHHLPPTAVRLAARAPRELPLRAAQPGLVPTPRLRGEPVARSRSLRWRRGGQHHRVVRIEQFHLHRCVRHAAGARARALRHPSRVPLRLYLRPAVQRGAPAAAGAQARRGELARREQVATGGRPDACICTAYTCTCTATCTTIHLI